ncbi:response regulator transcription factor [Flavobacterium soli]|uniref:response regulator transcription factor n=1 Tax=Flavobacterium soli TaxID=344881 RepID=UPI0003FCB003|nr:response regulator [Flavobacterium soli]
MQHNKPIRILIADDDLDEIELLKMAFDKHPDFEVVACLNSGQEIIDAVKKSNILPDVVFTDLYMPVLSGLEAAEILRMEKQNAKMEIIIFSTTLNPSIKEKASHLGITGTLLKPNLLEEYEALPAKVSTMLFSRTSGNNYTVTPNL